MKKGMKSVLTATILLTLSSVLGVQAADTTLEEVIVTADRTRITEDSAGSVYAGGYVGTNPSIGILGSKDYTKMPIQATSVTAQAIEQVKLPNNTISEAATLDPVVRARGGNA